MPKIQYKEINFRGKSLDLINLVNQVINEYKNQGYELTLRQTYYQLVYRAAVEVARLQIDLSGEAPKDADE